MTLKEQILHTLRRLFIILVGLTMTWFSGKMLISIDAYVVWCPTWSKKLGRYLLCSRTYLCISTKRLFSKNLQTWRSISKSGSKIISHIIAFGHSVPGAAQHMWTYSCRHTMAGNFKFWPTIMSHFSLQNW